MQNYDKIYLSKLKQWHFNKEDPKMKEEIIMAVNLGTGTPQNRKVRLF